MSTKDPVPHIVCDFTLFTYHYCLIFLLIIHFIPINATKAQTDHYQNRDARRAPKLNKTNENYPDIMRIVNSTFHIQ
jgi:hypothetical protein